jgi:DNA-binding response OmpR family regulator
MVQPSALRYPKLLNMNSKKVFVCDDDEGIIDLIGIILESAGYEVILETNSMNARSVIEKEKPDLIITDLWMPVVSGDQIVRMVRNSSENSDTPILVISASRDGEEISMGCGATAFLAKPFDLDGIVDLVAKVIKQS